MTVLDSLPSLWRSLFDQPFSLQVSVRDDGFSYQINMSGTDKGLPFHIKSNCSTQFLFTESPAGVEALKEEFVNAKQQALRNHSK